MATQFSNTPQVKIRTSLLVFAKGSSAPVVLYSDNVQAMYEELQQLLKSGSNAVIEKEGHGPIRKLTIPVNQISALALQDEQYV